MLVKMEKIALLSLLLLTSCTTAAKYLEHELECDETVKCEFKDKIDYEDNQD